MTDHSIARDRYGRPWVAHKEEPLQYVKGRKSPINAYAAKRVSGIPKALDDMSNLIPWAQSNAVVGLVRNPALLAQVSSLASKYPDPFRVPEAKKQLMPIIKDAEKSGGSEVASGMGTAFHEFTEILDGGGELHYMPNEYGPWLDAYMEATAGLEVLSMEDFVVNDELQAAGSFDRLVRMPDGRVVVADIKSGASNDRYPLGVTVQCAVYANSVRYNQVSGKREPIHPDLDTSTGLLIHAPIRSGEPVCNVFELDLSEGWVKAQLAVEVLGARKMGKLKRVDVSERTAVDA